jgi:hypothetical protein
MLCTVQVCRVEDQVQRLMAASHPDNPVRTVYEEIVPFEPWMLEPNAARTGRATGIQLEFTGPGGGRNNISTAANGEQPALSLFGHELLAAHPEILLAAHEMIEKPPEPVPPPASSSSSTAGFGSSSFGSFSAGRGGPTAKGGRSAVSTCITTMGAGALRAHYTKLSFVPVRSRWCLLLNTLVKSAIV